MEEKRCDIIEIIKGSGLPKGNLLLSRRFNVNNNIISAQMDYAGGVKFGIMLTEMHGTQQDTQAAIAWLQEHHVKVEVLGYV